MKKVRGWICRSPAKVSFGEKGEGYTDAIIIIYSFVCYFSKLEHIANYKAKNQSTVKTNFREHNRETQRDPELRSCVKVEVAVLGSPSLVSLMVSVDEKQH